MKRFYYSDPLAAAYMAKHFGMNYSFLPDGLSIEVGIGCIDPNGVGGKFYIQPDSLHLLEPRIGDRIFWDEDGWIVKTLADNELLRKYPDCRIIQRDGKPFFWPQSE